MYTLALEEFAADFIITLFALFAVINYVRCFFSCKISPKITSHYFFNIVDFELINPTQV